MLAKVCDACGDIISPRENRSFFEFQGETKLDDVTFDLCAACSTEAYQELKKYIEAKRGEYEQS